MKKIGIQLLFSILAVGCSFTAYAQNFSEETKTSMGEIRKLLDSNERDMSEEAKNNFEEANLILETVDNQDFELEKHFTKGSTPKAEKKTVNVKRNRIDASVLYEKGYTNIISAYDSRIDKLYYTFPEDKKAAFQLKGEAQTKMNEAKSKMDDYKFLDDKDLITYKYHTLQDDIEEVNKIFREAIDIQIRAFNLFFDQDSKQQELAITKEAPAEEKSTETNSSPSADIMSNMISDLPSSPLANEEMVDESRIIEKTKIEKPIENTVIEPLSSSGQESMAVEEFPTAIEEYNQQQVIAVTPVPAKKTQTVPAVSGVVFRIQLIAIKKGPLSTSDQSKLYTGPHQVMERQEDGMYKYTIGEFSTFREAKAFLKSLNKKDTFIVSFRDGKRIPLDEAIGYAY